MLLTSLLQSPNYNPARAAKVKTRLMRVEKKCTSTYFIVQQHLRVPLRVNYIQWRICMLDCRAKWNYIVYSRWSEGVSLTMNWAPIDLPHNEVV